MTATIALEKRMTAEEYLEQERANLREFGGKHEFFNQQLIEMAGRSIPHSGIESNLSFVFQTQSRAHKTNHLVLSSNAKVLSFLTYKNYLYPDLVVVEGRPFHADDNNDIVLNPSILVEVLSDSTESFDRGDKFRSYRQIKSLKEYILIAQDEYRIEHFFKDENERWQIGEVITEGSLKLIYSPIELSVEDVYFNVVFEGK
jgi:Uma2 family endonuclease